MAHEDDRKAECNWYILLMGFPRDQKSLILAPGVSVRPLPQRLTVFDLAAAGAAGFDAWAVLEPIAASCTCEIESAVDSAVTPGYDAMNRAWLATALLVLRGFTWQLPVACSTYTWATIAGHQQRSAGLHGKDSAADSKAGAGDNLPRFKGDLLDFHWKILTTKAARLDGISDGDARWVYEHYGTFNRLASEDDSFRLALEAAVDWRFAPEQRSAVARIWSGIEALFRINSELVYRISLLSACLLEPRGEKRRARFKEVKRLYGLRSKVVHGETLKADKIEETLVQSFGLLSSLLTLTADQGHVLNEDDFERAVFE